MIKIVTDSTADLPPQLVKELGITVVPLYVRFGEDVYRDKIDISEDEFYQRLPNDPIHPNTTQPTPKDFTDVYQKLAKEADGIISIHISAKLSGTCNSALQGKAIMEGKCPVEVVDSETVSMGLGLLAIAAAARAKSGGDLSQVVEEVKGIIPNIHLLILFDTLKYLALGGRIGKAKALLGSVLNVKPMLTLKDGAMVPAGQVRTRSKGKDRLFDSVKNATDIQDLAVVHSTTADEAQSLVERINSIFPKNQAMLTRLGPVLGVYGGPGVLAVAIREKGGRQQAGG